MIEIKLLNCNFHKTLKGEKIFEDYNICPATGGDEDIDMTDLREVIVDPLSGSRPKRVVFIEEDCNGKGVFYRCEGEICPFRKI